MQQVESLAGQEPVRLFPRLFTPDTAHWERYYPAGLGTSVFGAPAFQQAMQGEVEKGWSLRFLCAETPAGPLSMPVFAHRSRLGRYEIAVHPIAYYVTPIERIQLDPDAIHAICDAASSTFTAVFTWWLPPWVEFGVEQRSRLPAAMRCTSIESFVITCDGSWKQTLAKVAERQRETVRTSLRRGLVVIENPSTHQVEAYVDLYQRVHNERGWLGRPFSRPFFHAIARQLGEGGRLIVMEHEGRVIGGGVLLFDHHAVHYFQGITDRDVRAVHPHSVLYSEAIRQAELRGLPYVNLGGINDGNDGLARFKQQWGARRMAVPLLRWECSGREAGKRLLRSMFQRLIRTPKLVVGERPSSMLPPQRT